jgi:translation initiation factor 2B subunit (eIF-2B alpha/beta/delta family)
VLGGTVGILCLLIAVLLLEVGRQEPIVQLEAEASELPRRLITTVICAGAQQLTLHHNGETIATAVNSNTLANVLDNLENDPSRALVVGVKPGGFTAFRTLRRLAEERRIPLGFEPLEDGWRIRTADGAML